MQKVQACIDRLEKKGIGEEGEGSLAGKQNYFSQKEKEWKERSLPARRQEIFGKQNWLG